MPSPAEPGGCGRGLLINLEPDVERRLDALSALTGRGTADRIREVIVGWLEDMEDIAERDAVMERLRRRDEKTCPLEDVVEELGLED